MELAGTRLRWKGMGPDVSSHYQQNHEVIVQVIAVSVFASRTAHTKE